MGYKISLLLIGLIVAGIGLRSGSPIMIAFGAAFIMLAMILTKEYEE